RRARRALADKAARPVAEASSARLKGGRCSGQSAIGCEPVFSCPLILHCTPTISPAVFAQTYAHEAPVDRVALARAAMAGQHGRQRSTGGRRPWPVAGFCHDKTFSRPSL